MEGRAQLRCIECGRTREVAGEIPREYISSFASATGEEGWVVRPGPEVAMICGQCLIANYSGHESVQDEPKVRGDRNPKSV